MELFNLKTSIMFNKASEITDKLLTQLDPNRCLELFMNSYNSDPKLIPIPKDLFGWYYKNTDEFCSSVFRRGFLLNALNALKK